MKRINDGLTDRSWSRYDNTHTPTDAASSRAAVGIDELVVISNEALLQKTTCPALSPMRHNAAAYDEMSVSLRGINSEFSVNKPA